MVEASTARTVYGDPMVRTAAPALVEVRVGPVGQEDPEAREVPAGRSRSWHLRRSRFWPGSWTGEASEEKVDRADLPGRVVRAGKGARG